MGTEWLVQFCGYDPLQTQLIRWSAVACRENPCQITYHWKLNPMRILNEKQANSAMFYFMKKYYQQTKADGLGEKLGEMSLLVDGTPADPGIQTDWQEAIDFALAGGDPDSFTLSKRR